MTRTTFDYFDGPLAEHLSTAQPTEDIDAGPTLGWFGLYPNHDRPGGAILHRDPGGFTTAWYGPSSKRLEQAWREIRYATSALRPGR